MGAGSHAAAATLLRRACTDCGTAWKDGAPLSLGTSVMDAETSHQGQGSQQQPRGQAPTSTGSFILEKSLIKCNQFLCIGGGGGEAEACVTELRM